MDESQAKRSFEKNRREIELMAIQKTEAFVIKTQAFRSSSLIITFLSKSFGKLKGIAKGVRKERETRGALFELFTHVEIIFYEKLRSELHLVSEASIIDSNNSLRSRLDTISYASYFSELVDHVCEVHDPNLEIYELLDFSFRFLSSVPAEKLARIFEVKLVREIGWLPHLDGCVECSDHAFEKGYFSIQHGAMYCPRCAVKHPEAKVLGESMLALLRYYMHHTLDESLKLPVSGPVASELGHLMGQFIGYRIGIPLKSRRFLNMVQPVLQF